MIAHGAEIVDAAGRRWRAFLPGWRLWLWLAFFTRRLVVTRLPGSPLPFVGWSRSSVIDLTVGMPPRRLRVRAERDETGSRPSRRVRGRSRT